MEKELTKERMRNFTQHFALKEEATLSKLQHFKEQLRIQKEAMTSGSDHVTGMRQPCDDHVKAAWSSDDVTQQSPGIGQSNYTESPCLGHATKDQAVIGGESKGHRSYQPMRMQDEIKHSSSEDLMNEKHK